MELLADVGWRQAAARPIAGAHCIVELTPQQDFPHLSDSSEESWRDSVQALVQRQEALAGLTATLTDQQLDAICPGKDYSLYFLLHGVVQHNLYHAGQIALLKKT